MHTSFVSSNYNNDRQHATPLLSSLARGVERMTTRKTLKPLLFLSCCAYLAFPKPAHALLDSSVAKTGPSTANAGDTITYNVTVQSTTDINLTGVTVTDPLPADTTFVSATQNSGPTATSITKPTVGTNGTFSATLPDITSEALGVQSIADVNGTVFMTGGTLLTGTELYKSDGTPNGTVLVKDILSGLLSSGPANLTNVGGTLFFTASDGLNGTELWKSDGTAAGTVMVKDINAGILGSSPTNLINVGGTLYFTATDLSCGRELWKSNGTAAGTVRVKDINAALLDSSPTQLTNANGTLFFAATTAANGEELWKTDGTDAGTVQLKDINAGILGSSIDSMASIGGTVYFSATPLLGTAELWKSDGTAAGTVLVKDINSNIGGSSSPQSLTNVGGTLLFSATDGSTGRELWKSDGTTAGTVIVKDIYSGSTGSSPANFVNVGGTLFFTATDSTGGTELWKSGATSATTVRVKDIYSGTSSSSPGSLTNVNGTLFFSANDGTAGTELWKSDGSSAGTVRVKDIVSGSGSSSPANLTASGSKCFFTVVDGLSLKPWVSDGTDAGTISLQPSSTVAATFAITVKISPDASGTISNTATISGNPLDLVPSNNTSTVNTAITAVPLTVGVGDASINEGNSGTTSLYFPVVLSRVSTHDIVINYNTANGTATAGSDYVAVTSGTLTIPAGQTTGSITITINGDVNYEPDETFTVHLSAASNGATIGAADGTGTIVNDDAATDVSITKTAGATATANDNLTYQIVVANTSASGSTMTDALPTGTTFVSATQTNGPTATLTKPSVGANGTFSAVMPALTSCTFSVTVKIAETASGALANTATVTSPLTDINPSNNTSTATTNVTALPALTVGISSASSNEGDSGATSLNFPVALSRVSGQDTVINYNTVDGTATAGSDYVAVTSGTLTIPAGQTTGSIAITINGDTTYEPNETFTVHLSAASNGATIGSANGTGTIVNDDAATDISITKTAAATATAGDNLTYQIVVANTSASGSTMSDTLPTGTTFVSMTQASGPTATLTKPTVGANGTVSAVIPALSSASFNVTVKIAETASGSISNTATVTSPLTDINPSNNTATATTSVTALPALTVGISNASINEGNSGTSSLYFPVTLSRVSGQDTVINYNTVDGTALAGSDYVAVTSGTLTIPAGQTTGSIVITINGDITYESDETFTVHLSGASNGATIGAANGTGTIVNDDPATDVSITKTAAATATAGDNLTYQIVVANTSASGSTMTDVLPAGTTFVSATQTNGPTATLTKPTVGTNGTFSAVMPALSSCTFSVVVKIANTVSGPLANTATVTSPVTDIDPSNNTSTASTTVLHHRPALAMSASTRAISGRLR